MNYQVKQREDDIDQSWSITQLGTEGINSRFKQISGIEIKIDRVEASFRLLQDESKKNVESVLSNTSLDKSLREEVCRANHIAVVTP